MRVRLASLWKFNVFNVKQYLGRISLIFSMLTESIDNKADHKITAAGIYESEPITRFTHIPIRQSINRFMYSGGYRINTTTLDGG